MKTRSPLLTSRTASSADSAGGIVDRGVCAAPEAAGPPSPRLAINPVQRAARPGCVSGHREGQPIGGGASQGHDTCACTRHLPGLGPRTATVRGRARAEVHQLAVLAAHDGEQTSNRVPDGCHRLSSVIINRTPTACVVHPAATSAIRPKTDVTFAPARVVTGPKQW